MKYAIIDLGSNSVRLSIYSYENGKFDKILNQKEIVGLAEYVTNDTLDIIGIQKACAILKVFKEIALNFTKLPDIHLVATASLRNITNRAEAVKLIVEETGLMPDVIEGETEAALGFAGASQYVNCDNGVMIDIGGASTEIVLFRDYRVVNLVSLPIGCLNLAVKYVSEIIPKKSEMKQITEAIRNQFSKINWETDADYPLMIGIGGTLRAALKLSHSVFDLPPEQKSIETRYIKKITKLLIDNKKDIYHTTYKTIPERLMTILPGLAILRFAIKKFECKTITVSEYGVREGYLVDRVLKKHDESAGSSK
ncbi:MAG: phosphatase [Nitrososphaerota archaeon]|jgi:exopolyphosphatase/guanosine-5'-triphosphate,3'-diphosphate pyrophosphatase|uniref:Ppx/GppA phosphatase family protein n=1 Tax=Candidatus Bathycorpusculum sp. TaxID=2994959 RepID=UPI002816BC7F|nr:phosphatase [Candidatus Termiticorpusculum sp.]MCL2257195.1 phosphatase [Candidatus Termiticorpusculum sp.]MCL2292676.1 phosphatase [Candidatus Termiticorpusculum sp.]MDR0460921.1 phosphatase [Nitrososphaerota archaeon]